MNLETIQSIQNTGIHLTFKLGVLVILILFILFLFVILKQIRAMNRILTQDDLFPYLRSFTLLLIAGVIVLFIISIVIL